MNSEAWGVAASLALLTGVLGALVGRGLVRFARSRDLRELPWVVGLGLGTLATALELVAYVGFDSVLLLQGYVFCSAGIVGVLSLGSVRALRRPFFAKVYFGYTAVALVAVAWASFATPLSLSMVRDGVIAGNPPVMLLVLSSFVTVPATVVLLTACVISLRRSFRYRGLLVLAGASVLGAGGAFYIASFPVLLYYAEFVGIVLLFLGLVDLSRWATASPASTPIARAKSP